MNIPFEDIENLVRDNPLSDTTIKQRLNELEKNSHPPLDFTLLIEISKFLLNRVNDKLLRDDSNWYNYGLELANKLEKL